MCDEGDYETDGIVLKVEDRKQHLKLGVTAHHPRWALAWKFSGSTAWTILSDIEWSVGRTGQVTPVAIVEPVVLAGAAIQRASLHNLNIMRELGWPTKGCAVLISRRGGVIPHVEKIIPGEGESFPYPEVCPKCHAQLREENGILTAKHDNFCIAQLIPRYEHFAHALGIKGLGPKQIEQLVDKGLLAHPALPERRPFIELLVISEADLILALGQVGVSIYKQMADAQPFPWDKLLFALGIPGVGKTVAQKLSKRFPTVDRLLEASVDDILGISGVGEVTRSSLEKELRELSDILRVIEAAYGITTWLKTNPFVSGKTFVFTGPLQSMSREEATDKVELAGGVVASTVTRKCSFVVVDDETFERVVLKRDHSNLSTKLEKALKNDEIHVVSEKAFLEMVG
jgi:DNA ligase (NAD+)